MIGWVLNLSPKDFSDFVHTKLSLFLACEIPTNVEHTSLFNAECNPLAVGDTVRTHTDFAISQHKCHQERSFTIRIFLRRLPHRLQTS
jgi:hypothetical protein